jgi:hypothetical protein
MLKSAATNVDQSLAEPPKELIRKNLPASKKAAAKRA